MTAARVAEGSFHQASDFAAGVETEDEGTDLSASAWAESASGSAPIETASTPRAMRRSSPGRSRLSSVAAAGETSARARSARTEHSRWTKSRSSSRLSREARTLPSSSKSPAPTSYLPWSGIGVSVETTSAERNVNQPAGRGRPCAAYVSWRTRAREASLRAVDSAAAAVPCAAAGAAGGDDGPRRSRAAAAEASASALPAFISSTRSVQVMRGAS